MDLHHEFTVPATLDETWAAFNDISSVAQCFPGAQVSSVEGETFHGSVKVKLGPIALVYNGTGTFLDKDESAHTMRIEAKGKDRRGNGTAGAHVLATMTDEGGGNTRVQVHTDLAITGKPAQFGRGVIQDVSDKLLGQFTACLENKVGAPEEAPAAPEPVAVVSPVASPVSPTAASSVSSSAAATAPAAAAAAAAASAEADHATGAAKAKQEAAPPGPVTAAPPRPADGDGDDALDLGATVLPILVKGYWREGLIGLLAALLLWRWRRRR